METTKGNCFKSARITKLTKIIQEAKINGQKSIYKTLPYNIMEWDKNSISELIGGLYDTDGCVSIEQRKKSIKIIIKYTTISPTIAYDVQRLLRKFGISSFIESCQPKPNEFCNAKHLVYNVLIRDKESVEKFANNIKLLVPHKKNNLIKGLELLSDHKYKISKDLIDSDLRFAKVKSIEHIPQQHVYDLTVHNVPCYNVTKENIKENNIKITLNSGKEIIAHENYKVLSYINNEMVYIPMQDIKEKQYIGVPNKLFNLGDYYENMLEFLVCLLETGIILVMTFSFLILKKYCGII